MVCVVSQKHNNLFTFCLILSIVLSRVGLVNLKKIIKFSFIVCLVNTEGVPYALFNERSPLKKIKNFS